jgi:hypothetical protein
VAHKVLPSRTIYWRPWQSTDLTLHDQLGKLLPSQGRLFQLVALTSRYSISNSSSNPFWVEDWVETLAAWSP